MNFSVPHLPPPRASPVSVDGSFDPPKPPPPAAPPAAAPSSPAMLHRRFSGCAVQELREKLRDLQLRHAARDTSLAHRIAVADERLETLRRKHKATPATNPLRQFIGTDIRALEKYRFELRAVRFQAGRGHVQRTTAVEEYISMRMEDEEGV